jgi:ABC-type multidrug transport system ATPase subunit
MELPAPKGEIIAEHVTFALNNTFILRDINFNLAPGESLGLIGPSGAGKSTLCRLLLGIWPPSGGVVRLDGANIYDWDNEKLGPHVGYLPQDIELFSGTVAENIARLKGCRFRAGSRSCQTCRRTRTDSQSAERVRHPCRRGWGCPFRRPAPTHRSGARYLLPAASGDPR